MIFVIEIPHNEPARSWSAPTRQEYVATMAEKLRGQVTFESCTPRELMTQYGIDTPEEAKSEEPWIAQLYEEYGMYTTLHRVNEGAYQTAPIDPFDAYTEHLRSTLATLHIFDGVERANAALADVQLLADPVARGELKRLLAQAIESQASA